MNTERLELVPMTAEEVFALAESCGDAELAEAYREMGTGCLNIRIKRSGTRRGGSF